MCDQQDDVCGQDGYVTSMMGVWPVGWGCDQQDGSVTSRMGV